MSFDHIHPSFQHIMALSNDQRIDFLKQDRWISYAGADRLLETLRSMLETPAQVRMPCMLIVGDSNNGKSSIVKHFVTAHGQTYTNADNEAVKPVVLAEALPSGDERSLYIAILNQFYTPNRPTRPPSELRAHVVHLMRAYKVRMLMIDEFHSLTSGSAKDQRIVMNAIKYLCNELAIPIVGIGTNDAVPVLHQDPQHASRFEVRSLPLWKFDKTFQNRLRGIELVLPLLHPSNLRDLATGTALFAIARGNLGNLHNLIVRCGQEAIRSGRERIDLEIIKAHAWMGDTIRKSDA